MFRDTSNVNSNFKIEQLLCTEGLEDIFQTKERPDVFILIVLAHGEEDGKIKTDDDQYFFTTFRVWDSLNNNENLQTCVKISFFGVNIQSKFILFAFNFVQITAAV
jgi:hypothetical protein